MESSGMPLGAKLIVLGIVTLVALVLLVAMWPFAQIDQTQRGVVLRNGALVRTMDPGLHWRTPLVEHVVKMNVSFVKEEVQAAASSKDLQNANTTVSINYQVDVSKVAQLYTEYENDHSDRVVAPAIQEAVKAATAKYTAEELVTKRELVKAEIGDSLKKTLSPHNIEVKEFFITDFKFSEQFNVAIEAKVKAEQDALKAQNDLKRVQFEADQRVATAEAEAKAIRLSSDAANNQRYIELKRLEVQQKFAEKWNGVGCQNNCWGVDAQQPIPFLNTRQQ